MTAIEQELNDLRSDLAAQAAAPETSLAEMNQLAVEIAQLRDAETAAAKAKSDISAELEAKENRVMELLIENNLNSYKAPEGTLSLSFRFSAKLPVGPAKEAFFAYLRSQGRFDELVSVSSATYTAFVKEAYELAREQGKDEPTIPGVTDVKTSPRLSFRRAR